MNWNKIVGAGKLYGAETKKQAARKKKRAAVFSQRTNEAKTKARDLNKGDFYQSREWLALRYRVLKLNDGRCELCGRNKHDGVNLHVDHIKPRSRHPELQLEISNLQVLCNECNLGKGNKCKRDWRAPTKDDLRTIGDPLTNPTTP